MNLLELFVKIGVKDEVSSKLETVSATAIAKGQLIASAIQNAVQRAMGAIQSFLGSALSAFGQYQQQVGGMETFFGDSANTVIANAKRAYETAGMSANQYMSNVSGFAMSLITSVAKRRNKVVQQDTETQAKALDTQVDNLSEALSRNLTNRQRELSAEYQARSDELSDELEQLQDALARQLKERQKALDKEVSDFQKATDKRLKEIDREYTERLKLTDEEEYRRIKALQDQNDALDAETDAERKAQKSREQQQKIADLKREAATAKFIEDREKAERELADYLADIEQDSREEQRNEQKKANNDEIQRIKDEFDRKRKQIREQQSQEVEDYKETRARELEELRESNARKLEEMSEANRRTIKEQQRANRDILRDMQNAHNDELQAMRDSNSRQLRELQNSLANQKSALADSADAIGDYIETTAEDQAEAARIADMAMRDMSDNANKMGTDIGMIEAAYQGFAKDNFTMLDNLRLGYGGTRHEMERLLQDAEAIKAKNGEVVDYSISNFADIVEAIHVIQEEMGITGTTADEANKTVEGSINKMRAAWENWLVAVASGQGDVGEATENLLESIEVVINNVAPVIKTTLKTVFDYVQEHGPEVFERLKNAILDSLPPEWREKVDGAIQKIETFINKVGEIIDSLGGVEGIADNAIKTFNTFGDSVNFVATVLGPIAPLLLGIGATSMAIAPIVTLFQSIGSAVSTLTGLFGGAGTAATSMGTAAAAGAGQAGAAATGAGGAFAGLSGAVSTAGTAVASALGPAAIAGGAVAGVGLLTNEILESTGAIDRFKKSVEEGAYDATENFTHMSSVAVEESTKASSAYNGAATDIDASTSEAARSVVENSGSIQESIKSQSEATGNWTEAIKSFFGGMTEATTTSSGEMKNVLLTDLDSMNTGVTVGTASMGSAWSQSMADMKQSAIDASSGVKVETASMLTDIRANFSGSGELLKTSGNSMVAGFGEGAEHGGAWENVKNFFKGILNWIVQNKGPIDRDRQALVPAGNAIMQGLRDGSERGWPDVQGFFLGIPNSITGLFSGSGSWLQGNGVEILNGLQSGMGNAWNSVASFVSSIPSGITGAFSNAGDWLVGAGSNIMTGLYNGLVSIYNNYIQPLISGVGQWMQQHKGPESYDKKLLVNNGKWIMGGFQSGLESGFEGGVIPYVSGMGRDIQDALGASVSSPFATTVGRAVGTQQQRQQPTMITAILELDRVQFGRLVYQLNGEETQRMGVNLAGGMA